MISQTVEYALRAVVSLAHEHGRPCTAAELAEVTKVPSTYLSKVMWGLVRNGLVHSQRGPGGGFILAREPDEITIWDITDAVDPVPRIRSCPLGIKSHSGQLCPLHSRLDQAMAGVEKIFRESRLIDLIGEGEERIVPLCEVQEKAKAAAAVDGNATAK